MKIRRRAGTKPAADALPKGKGVGRARVRALESDEPKSSSRWGHLAKVAAEFSDFRPAPEVLTAVRAVPTIFPQFDLITRVGGLPIERFTLLHGPSTGGKTYAAIALMLSFLMRGDPVFFVDAERTTPIPWLRAAMGEFADHPLFRAVKPESYEETREDVRTFCNKVRTLREKGKLRPDASALVVVDSFKKLVPKDQFERIASHKDQEQGARSRIDQQKAAMNAAWLDDLVILLDTTGTAMVAIARETVDADAPPPRVFGGRKAEPKMKTGGGAALFYDASLDLRSSRIKSYGKEIDGKFVVYGDVHRLDILKSKVSGKESQRASCEFHISNGTHTPAGFDRSRDLVNLARRFDVIEGTQALRWRDRKWRGEDKAIASLVEDVDAFAGIEADCRALFPKVAGT